MLSTSEYDRLVQILQDHVDWKEPQGRQDLIAAVTIGTPRASATLDVSGRGHQAARRTVSDLQTIDKSGGLLRRLANQLIEGTGNDDDIQFLRRLSALPTPKATLPTADGPLAEASHSGQSPAALIPDSLTDDAADDGEPPHDQPPPAARPIARPERVPGGRAVAAGQLLGLSVLHSRSELLMSLRDTAWFVLSTLGAVSGLVTLGVMHDVIPWYWLTGQPTAKTLSTTSKWQEPIFEPIIAAGGIAAHTTQDSNGRFGVEIHPPDGSPVLLNERTGVALAGGSSDGKQWLLRYLPGRSREDNGRIGMVTLRNGGELSERSQLVRHGYEAARSPDGTSLAYTADRHLKVVDKMGAETTPYTSATGRLTQPRWSPDGRRIRFTVDLPRPQILEVQVDSHLVRPLFTALGGAVCCGDWTNDGEFYVFKHIDKDHSVTMMALANGEIVTPVKQLPEVIRPLQCDVKSESLLGASIMPDSLVVRIDQATGTPAPHLKLPIETLAHSPDGNRIAYTEFPRRALWLINGRTDASPREMLTPMETALPSWSPKGDKIAFAGQQRGIWRIFLLDVESKKYQELYEDDSVSQIDPTWSPDGTQIVYGRNRQFPDAPQLEIYRFDLVKREKSTISGSQGKFSPRWSPNGRFIVAITGDDEHHLHLYEKGQWRVLITEDAAFPSWSNDSQYIYYHHYDKVTHGNSLRRVDVSSGKAITVSELGFARPPARFGWWIGITPYNDLLAIKDMTTHKFSQFRLQFE